ncbi:MAG: hypothetical protein WCW17_00595 [Patescibacteria group bacterium]|jgi:hypothetical protein
MKHTRFFVLVLTLVALVVGFCGCSTEQPVTKPLAVKVWQDHAYQKITNYYDEDSDENYASVEIQAGEGEKWVYFSCNGNPIVSLRYQLAPHRVLPMIVTLPDSNKRLEVKEAVLMRGKVVISSATRKW